MALFQLMLVFSFVWIVKSQATFEGSGINMTQRDLGNILQGVVATNAVHQQVVPPQAPLPHPLANLPSKEPIAQESPPITLPKSCKHLSISNKGFEDGWQWINPISIEAKDPILVYCKKDGSSCIYPKGSEPKNPLLLLPDTKISYSEHELKVLQKISKSAEQEFTYACNGSNLANSEFNLYKKYNMVIPTPNLHPEIANGVCNGEASRNVRIEGLSNLPIVRYNEKDSKVENVKVGPVCFK